MQQGRDNSTSGKQVERRSDCTQTVGSHLVQKSLRTINFKKPGQHLLTGGQSEQIPVGWNLFIYIFYYQWSSSGVQYLLTLSNLSYPQIVQKYKEFIAQISLFKIDLLLFISVMHMAEKWQGAKMKLLLIFRGGHRLITQTAGVKREAQSNQ